MAGLVCVAGKAGIRLLSRHRRAGCMNSGGSYTEQQREADEQRQNAVCSNIGHDAVESRVRAHRVATLSRQLRTCLTDRLKFMVRNLKPLLKVPLKFFQVSRCQSWRREE